LAIAVQTINDIVTNNMSQDSLQYCRTCYQHILAVWTSGVEYTLSYQIQDFSSWIGIGAGTPEAA